MAGVTDGQGRNPKRGAMKLTTGRTKLAKAYKVLCQRWDQVRPGWHDEVSRQFADDFLAPLQQQTQATLRGIDRLSEILEEVYKDCG